MQQSSKFVLTLIAVFLISINLRPAITSVGPLLNTILEDLQISNTQISLLTSIPVFCMGLFAPLTGYFQRQWGTRKSVSILLLLIGVATLTRIIFSSFTALLLTSFIAGFAIAIISPMINAFIKVRFPTKTASVIGLYSFGMGAGATLSAGLTGVFYEQFNEDWPLALGIWGVLVFVAIGTWLITTRSKVSNIKVEEEVVEVRNAWKNSRAWIILLFFGVQTSLFFSLTTWLAPIATEQGFTLIAAGAVLTAMSLVQMAGNILIPLLMDKWPNRVNWLFGLLAIGLIGAVILWIGTPWAIWTGAVILGLSLSGLFPIGLLLPLDEARNSREANEWSSMVLSGGFMMSAIVPLFIGVVYDITGTHFTQI